MKDESITTIHCITLISYTYYTIVRFISINMEHKNLIMKEYYKSIIIAKHRKIILPTHQKIFNRNHHWAWFLNFICVFTFFILFYLFSPRKNIYNFKSIRTSLPGLFFRLSRKLHSIILGYKLITYKYLLNLYYRIQG